MNVYDGIEKLKGVGPKSAELLKKCNIYTIIDLLLYFPRTYINLKETSIEDGAVLNEKICIVCTAAKIERDIRTQTGKTISTVVFKKNETYLKAKWFNQPYIKNKFTAGDKYRIMGKVQKEGNKYVITSPVLIESQDNNVLPVYSLKEGLTNNFFRKIINQILVSIEVKDNMPINIIQKYRLTNLDSAIKNIHNPKNSIQLQQAIKRLKFQELFVYSLKILILKDKNKIANTGIGFKISPLLKDLKDKIPYKLTNAQNVAIREILLDEKKNIPMNRLLQGDVGCGKTIIAIIAMFNVVMNGYQAVIMAPTEILANQHYAEFTRILAEFNININLLTGSTSMKNKEKIKEELKNGTIQMLIGTHALLEDSVEFNKLGMVVTDEQHRFGVMQRAKLYNKGDKIDMLVMTATPIPRTLALYLYGDLDVSIIDELPPGRKKIDTTYYRIQNKKLAYEFALSQIKLGRQVYIVCPLVEEGDKINASSVEKVYDYLKGNYFKNINMAILHGKMKSKEKDEIMARFKSGKISVLISTTVIEVGINVSNATVMIVENAERFGLSQLHQLRGRVGRGAEKSYCILLADIKNNNVKMRMDTMKNSNDGFYISEQDLKLRGSGEMFGLRQHGDDEFILADVMEDIDILKIASSEAKKVIFQKEQYNSLINEVENSIQNSSKYIALN